MIMTPGRRILWLVLVTLCQPASVAAQVLVDPMRPPAYAPVTGTDAGMAEWQLTSIVIARDRKVAVINGETVTIGSKLGNASVVNIKTSSVILVRNGEEILVNLVPATYKVPAITKDKK
jgi:MSHA biogenesis protein MshK